MDTETAGAIFVPLIIVALCGYFGILNLFRRIWLGVLLLFLGGVLSLTQPATGGVFLIAGLFGYLKNRTKT